MPAAKALVHLELVACNQDYQRAQNGYLDHPGLVWLALVARLLCQVGVVVVLVRVLPQPLPFSKNSSPHQESS